MSLIAKAIEKLKGNAMRKVNCPSCNRSHETELTPGQRIECEGCGCLFKIPGAVPEPERQENPENLRDGNGGDS